MKVECAYKELVPLEKIIPNPRNPNTHSKEQIKLLSKIIDAQGWRAPITVSRRSGFIVRGHARLKAAQLLKLEMAPVDFQDYESEAQEWADLIADNRIAELAEVDMPSLKDILQELDDGSFDMDLTGFDSKSLEDLMLQTHEEGLTDDDEVPEPQESICKPGDLWVLGNHRLLCGDATVEADVAKLMAGERADMVFTDPPYGIDYGEKNRFLNSFQPSGRNLKDIAGDALSKDELLTMLTKAFTLLRENSQDECSYYVTAPQGGELGLMMMMMMMMSGLPVRHVLIWVKNQPGFSLGRLDYDYQHEPILYAWNKKHRFIGKGEFTKSVWAIDRPRENKEHPTMKPVPLIENALKNSSTEDAIVCDWFGGSGSTLIACEKLNRKCRMMEIDPHYCDVIINRWQNFTGKTAELQ